MAALRVESGYSPYYGSSYDNSEPLSKDQMAMNAVCIHFKLSSIGWTTNAIAGILGNMEAESTINPGRWQSDDVGNTSLGYGLVQWTPATKYIDWCSGQGISDASLMSANINRIMYEVENNLQWIGVGDYSNMSFSDFTKSTLSPGELAKAFLLCYERPADQSSDVQEYRASLADVWYQLIQQEGGGGAVSKKNKRKKFKFILFNKRRRNTWTKRLR